MCAPDQSVKCPSAHWHSVRSPLANECFCFPLWYCRNVIQAGLQIRNTFEGIHQSKHVTYKFSKMSSLCWYFSAQFPTIKQLAGVRKPVVLVALPRVLSEEWTIRDVYQTNWVIQSFRRNTGIFRYYSHLGQMTGWL
jgi:hypothetical protein